MFGILPVALDSGSREYALDPSLRRKNEDKFLGSNLDEKLKAGGIQTVIVCGTSFLFAHQTKYRPCSFNVSRLVS